jgi:hypothetical protein
VGKEKIRMAASAKRQASDVFQENPSLFQLKGDKLPNIQP